MLALDHMETRTACNIMTSRVELVQCITCCLHKLHMSNAVELCEWHSRLTSWRLVKQQSTRQKEQIQLMSFAGSLEVSAIPTGSCSDPHEQ